MPVRSDGIRDRCKLSRNPPSHLGNQGKQPSTWRTSFSLPLPRRGRAFVLLRSHHAPFFGGNPFTPKLRGCTAVPLPAHATCGRDKRRPGRVRLGGGALAVESADHQWKRTERTAIRAALSGEDRAPAASARRAGNRGGACAGAARSARQGCRVARWRHSVASVGRLEVSSQLRRRSCLLVLSFGSAPAAMCPAWSGQVGGEPYHAPANDQSSGAELSDRRGSEPESKWRRAIVGRTRRGKTDLREQSQRERSDANPGRQRRQPFHCFVCDHRIPHLLPHPPKPPSLRVWATTRTSGTLKIAITARIAAQAMVGLIPVRRTK